MKDEAMAGKVVHRRRRYYQCPPPARGDLFRLPVSTWYDDGTLVVS